MMIVMMSQTQTHKDIDNLKVKDEERIIIFAAARILRIAKIAVEIKDMGDTVRITGEIPFNLGVGKQLNRLGITKKLNYYTYRKTTTDESKV